MSENINLFHKGCSSKLRLTCLTGLVLTKQLKLLLIQIKQNSWIQTNKIGGQPYSDTSTCIVSEYSLLKYY